MRLLDANKLCQFSFIASAIAASLIAPIQPTDARPYPDQTGVCYFFRGETRELMQTCVVSGGYGAGGHYSVLQWPDGVQTNITMVNLCPNQDYDTSGFCRYTVDDHAAVPYQRNVFFDTTTSTDSDNLDCYRVVETGNSICYRLNE